MDRQERARLDNWLTRSDLGYYEKPPQSRCYNCGRFLSSRPDKVITHEETEHCDGKVQAYLLVYTENDAGILDIIGWDKLGKTYTEEYGPVCNETSKPHEPHDYTVYTWLEEQRKCNSCHFTTSTRED